MEMHRTHWAVKTPDLPQVLAGAGLLKKPAALKPDGKTTAKKKRKTRAKKKPVQRKRRTTKRLEEPGKTKVFVVHGHDTHVKTEISAFLGSLGLEPIILHERPNGGRTLITKFQEESSDVKFAVVMMTPDDVGGKKGGTQRPRPRQNVIFELGFFIGKLGSPMVCALFTDDVERPSDFDAVVYISYGADGHWKEELARELRHAHITPPEIAEAAKGAR
jgi:predicted nucleotide-binding protein